jgi:hypothetical protein
MFKHAYPRWPPQNDEDTREYAVKDEMGDIHRHQRHVLTGHHLYFEIPLGVFLRSSERRANVPYRCCVRAYQPPRLRSTAPTMWFQPHVLATKRYRRRRYRLTPTEIGVVLYMFPPAYGCLPYDPTAVI